MRRARAMILALILVWGVSAGVGAAAAPVPLQESEGAEATPPLTRVQRLQLLERAKRAIEEELPGDALRVLGRIPPTDDATQDALVLVLTAEAHYALEDLAAAVPVFEAALTLAPELRGRVYHLGLAYQKLDRLDDAETVFAALLEEDSALIRAKGAFGLGLNRFLEGEDAEGVRLLERSIALDPGATRAHYRLGQRAQARGDGAEAERRLRRVLELDPRHHGAAYNLALVLAARGEEVESRRWMQRSQELVRAREQRSLLRDRLRAAGGKATPELLAALGENALALDRYREAIEWYRRALKQDRENRSLLMGLGRATAGHGDARNAERLYRKLLELEPPHEAARAPLIELLEKQGRKEEADALRKDG